MTSLLIMKERLKSFYIKNEKYLKPCMRFILAFITFLVINNNIGYMEQIDNIIVVLFFSFIGAFLSVNVTIIILFALTIVNLCGLSLEMAGVAALIFSICILLHLRFTSRYGVVLLLVPIAFLLKIPYIIPLAMGLIGTPILLIPVSGGIIIYYILNFVSNNSATISKAYNDSAIEKFVYITRELIGNEEMLLMLGAFIVTFLVVYIVRRMSIDYAWNIAVVAGTVINILLNLIGDFAFNISISIIPYILGNIISFILAMLLQFLLFSVDYSRTEKVQFEDDEYYYYVKAVPKIYISAPEKTIKKINEHK